MTSGPGHLYSAWMLRSSRGHSVCNRRRRLWHLWLKQMSEFCIMLKLKNGRDRTKLLGVIRVSYSLWVTVACSPLSGVWWCQSHPGQRGLNFLLTFIYLFIFLFIYYKYTIMSFYVHSWLFMFFVHLFCKRCTVCECVYSMHWCEWHV